MGARQLGARAARRAGCQAACRGARRRARGGAVPSRAPRRWRGGTGRMGSPHGRCNGVRRCGVMGTSRRVRGPAAHRAADRAAACKTLSVCGMPSRAPRWRAATGSSAAARAGRPGGQASRPTATGHKANGPYEGARRCGRRVVCLVSDNQKRWIL